MLIKDIEIMRDGGSMKFYTNLAIIVIDNRHQFFSDNTTPGHMYLGYPEEDNSNIMEDLEHVGKLEKELLEALENYEDKFYCMDKIRNEFKRLLEIKYLN